MNIAAMIRQSIPIHWLAKTTPACSAQGSSVTSVNSLTETTGDTRAISINFHTTNKQCRPLIVLPTGNNYTIVLFDDTSL